MNFDEQPNKSISELLLPVKMAFTRYRSVAWAPALAVTMIFAVITVVIPSYYVSDVTILIQPSKVDSNLIKAPREKERQELFEALIQKLRSRIELGAIVDKFNPYPELSGYSGREKSIKRLNDALAINSLHSHTGKQLEQIFKVTFSHSSAKMAYAVAKRLSDNFIASSTIAGGTTADGTVEFFEASLRTIRKRLEKIESMRKEFEESNSGALPQSSDETRALLSNANSQLERNLRQVVENKNRTSFLQGEYKRAIAAAKINLKNAGGSSAVLSNNPATALVQLQQELAVLLTKYSQRHPDVISKKKQIQSVRRSLKSSGSNRVGTERPTGNNSDALTDVYSPGISSYRNQIADLQLESNSLQSENEEIKKKIAKLEGDLSSMPLKRSEYDRIERDYASIKEQYDQVLLEKERAVLKAGIVRAQKDAKFSIADPATLPLVPAGPMRPAIAAGGLLAGLLVFILLPLVLLLLNGGFKFREEAESVLGVPVIGTIPPMKTADVVSSGRRLTFASVFLSLLTFVGGSAVVLVLL